MDSDQTSWFEERPSNGYTRQSNINKARARIAFNEDWQPLMPSRHLRVSRQLVCRSSL
jgi:hypothetical protein